MKNLKINVKRSQVYVEARNGGSYNYEYDQTPPPIQTEEVLWWEARCNMHTARQKFIDYCRIGVVPDFSQEISEVNNWLNEHGEKGGEWAGTIETYRSSLEFLNGGYKKIAQMFEPIEVTYFVETVKSYSINKSNVDKWMPNKDENTFTHIETGFIIL